MNICQVGRVELWSINRQIQAKSTAKKHKSIERLLSKSVVDCSVESVVCLKNYVFLAHLYYSRQYSPLLKTWTELIKQNGNFGRYKQQISTPKH